MPKGKTFQFKTAISLLIASLIAIPYLGCSQTNPPTGEQTQKDGGTPEENGERNNTSIQPYAFPKNFFWGASIAGFQGDMGCPTLKPEVCEDKNSDWYQWVTDPSIIKKRYKGIDGKEVVFADGTPPSSGPGEWELYETDHRLLKKQLSGNAFRFSIEWSRIFPKPTFDANTYDELKKIADQRAIKHYHARLQSLKKLGITPFVTVNHYTLPLWIHNGVECNKDFDNCKAKGWADPKKLIPELVKYASFIAREFGGEIDYWLTINEPYAIVLPGYLIPSSQRVNPPGLSMKLELGRKVLLAIIEAHAKIYDAIKKSDRKDADGDGKSALIGIPYSFVPAYPKDPKRDLDIKAAQNLHYLLNYLFFDAVVFGKFDQNFDKKTTDRSDLKGRLDFIGVNFYASAIVRGIKKSPFPKLSPLFTADIFNLKDDYSYPKALYDLLLGLHQRYKLPIVITENGLMMPVDEKTGKIDDAKQPEYIVRNLFWAQRAVQKGVDLRGYLYWSIVDNYEWNHGMKLRFGLFSIDTEDRQKERKPRKGVKIFAEIASKNALPKKLLELYLSPEEKALLK